MGHSKQMMISEQKWARGCEMSTSPVEPTLLGLGTLVPRVTPLQRQKNRKSNSKKSKKPVEKVTALTSPMQLLQGWGDPLPPSMNYSRYG